MEKKSLPPHAPSERIWQDTADKESELQLLQNIYSYYFSWFTLSSVGDFINEATSSLAMPNFWRHLLIAGFSASSSGEMSWQISDESAGIAQTSSAA